MNQKFKSFLCKYFSDKYNRVTIGSIFKPIFVYSITIGFLIYSFYYSIPVFHKLIACPDCEPDLSVNGIVGCIGAVIITECLIMLLLYCIYKVISYISNIVMIKCERKE